MWPEGKAALLYSTVSQWGQRHGLFETNENKCLVYLSAAFSFCTFQVTWDHLVESSRSGNVFLSSEPVTQPHQMHRANSPHALSCFNWLKLYLITKTLKWPHDWTISNLPTMPLMSLSCMRSWAREHISHVCECVFRASASPSILGEGGSSICPLGVKDTDVTALITEAGSQRSWLSQPDSARMNRDPNNHFTLPLLPSVIPKWGVLSGNVVSTPPQLLAEWEWSRSFEWEEVEETVMKLI